jgi:hypothetical protein
MSFCWFSKMMELFEKSNKELVVLTAEEWRSAVNNNWKDCGFKNEQSFFKEYAKIYNYYSVYNERSDVMIVINEDKMEKTLYGN